MMKLGNLLVSSKYQRVT